MRSSPITEQQDLPSSRSLTSSSKICYQWWRGGARGYLGHGVKSEGRTGFEFEERDRLGFENIFEQFYKYNLLLRATLSIGYLLYFPQIGNIRLQPFNKAIRP